ncbi:uroporphyrinogen-III synthase [Metallibacterium sp.]|uniref:uroporphyrinogen-III synthase n=1 Tax=Metallibacterium sp. TaxID=2940281 RepID=UPI0031BA31AD
MPRTRAIASRPQLPLRGAELILTRCAGTARGEVRRVRRLGGTPLLLPGTRIAAAADPAAARAALTAALRMPICIFVSPAAVRAAAKLGAIRPGRRTRVVAVGAATARALRRHGVADVQTPVRADSEGLLALPALQPPLTRVALVGAPGGRELLPQTLAARGARVLRAEVYRRLPARLDRRHHTALAMARAPRYVLLSSSEALRNLPRALPLAARAAAGCHCHRQQRASCTGRARGGFRARRNRRLGAQRRPGGRCRAGAPCAAAAARTNGLIGSTRRCC